MIAYLAGLMRQLEAKRVELGIEPIGWRVNMWIEYANIKPTMSMGQSSDVLVAYYTEPDSDLYITIAFCDHGDWFERGTFRELPAPRYWMPLPELPRRR